MSKLMYSDKLDITPNFRLTQCGCGVKQISNILFAIL